MNNHNAEPSNGRYFSNAPRDAEEFERSLTAAVCQGKASIADFPDIQAADFDLDECRTLWSVLTDMSNLGLDPDEALIIADVKRVRPTVVTAVPELFGSTVSTTYLDHYAQQVKTAAIERLRVKKRAEIAEAAQAGDDEAVAELTAELRAMESRTVNDGRAELGWIDSTEFAARRYPNEWLVRYVMKPQQPVIVAGPSKALKTTLSVELAVSLASGTDFLDKASTVQTRVAVVSAESGEETLQETARRISAAKGIEFGDLGEQLFWAFRPPQINEPEHIASLRRFIDRNGIGVLMIDPAYLSMGIGDDAKNQFIVGEVLQNLTALQRDTGVTPILAAHTNKNIPIGKQLELSDIAYAGFGQWARQWVLINRQSEYDPEDEGHHQLFFAFGGSAGHAGCWALDINEGSVRDGRKWEFQVGSAADARDEAAEAAAAERERRAEQKRQKQHEDKRRRIIKAGKSFADGDTETEIRKAAGMSAEAFKPVWLELVTERFFEECGVIRKGNRQDYPRFKLVRDSAGRVLESATGTHWDSLGQNANCPSVPVGDTHTGTGTLRESPSVPV